MYVQAGLIWKNRELTVQSSKPRNLQVYSIVFREGEASPVSPCLLLNWVCIYLPISYPPHMPRKRTARLATSIDKVLSIVALIKIWSPGPLSKIKLYAERIITTAMNMRIIPPTRLRIPASPNRYFSIFPTWHTATEDNYLGLCQEDSYGCSFSLYESQLNFKHS